eukprot:SAG11_NODE_700_length_7673_cov_7.359255_2_plen_424_part_00
MSSISNREPNPSSPRYSTMTSTTDLSRPLNHPGNEEWWYELNPDQGLQRMGWCGKALEPDAGCCAKGAGFCGGVADDYRRRCPKFGKEIRQVFHRKTLSAALFMFFATFFSTASLGALIQKTTNRRIGLEEYLLMNSIAGMTHALFGCQPLLVLRPTGPITLIITMICKYADRFDLDFYQYLGATGFFVGLYMAIIAGTELCRLIKYLTRFTHDIFAFFVCSIYIHDGVKAVIDGFHSDNEIVFGESLFSALLAILTFVISMWLNFAITWKAFDETVCHHPGCFCGTSVKNASLSFSCYHRTDAMLSDQTSPVTIAPPQLRSLLTDYAVTIAVFAVIFISNIWSIEKHHVPRIEVPTHLGPTCQHLANSSSFSALLGPAPAALPWPSYNCHDCLCDSENVRGTYYYAKIPHVCWVGGATEPNG